jgi:hypothetical protein
MALVLADRVQQTGTANTTVSFTLSGSVTGFQSFSVVGNTNTTYYSATDASGNWEVGIGTYSTTGPTLTRTTILSSSNSGSAVTFSGTVSVLLTYPSGKSVNQDASGNVGIGTSSPTGKTTINYNTNTAYDTGLAVYNANAGSSAVTAFQMSNNAGNRAGAYLTSSTCPFYGGANTFNLGTVDSIPFTFLTGNSERMRIDSSGNVGIGTSSPAAKLDVSNGQFRLSNSYQVQWFNGATQLGSILTDGSSNLTFQTGSSNTERMRINSSGNVGINKSNPAYPLDVYASSGPAIMVGGAGSYTTSPSGLALGQYSSTIYYIQRPASTALQFWNSATNAEMTLDSSGNVGIGTSSPATKLEVYQGRIRVNATSDPAIEFANTSAVKGYVYYDSTNDLMVMRHASNSNGISVNSSGAVSVYTLNINNNTGMYCDPNQYVQYAVAASGYIQWNTSNGVVGTSYFVSDETKKDNIAPSTAQALPVINAIDTIAFDWKPETGQTGRVDLGISAQQLKSIDARFVAKLSDDTLMVKENVLLPYLIKSIQEQQVMINELKAKVAALESK